MSSVALMNDVSVCLHFLFSNLIHILLHFRLVSQQPFDNFRSMQTGTCKNDNSVFLDFLITSLDLYFYFIFDLNLNDHLK